MRGWPSIAVVAFAITCQALTPPAALAQSIPAVDLHVSIDDAPNPAVVGSNVLFTVTIGNHTPVGATDTTLVVDLPTTVQHQWTTTTRGTCAGTSTVFCDLGTVTLTDEVTVRIAVRAPAAGSLRTLAAVDADQDDAFPGDNRERVTTTVVPNAAGCTVVGTEGPDEIEGSARDDVICAYAGNDDIRAYAGNDIVHAGRGHDEVHGNDGADVLHGDEGHDTIRGDPGSDRVYGGRGDDDIRGGAGMDLVRGDAGTDFLSGSFGSDRLYGGVGDDSLYAHDTVSANDFADGGVGFDRCLGDAGDRLSSCEG